MAEHVAVIAGESDDGVFHQAFFANMPMTRRNWWSMCVQQA